MLSVVTLNVIMLNFVAPFKMLHTMDIIIIQNNIILRSLAKDKHSSLFCSTVSDK